MHPFIEQLMQYQSRASFYFDSQKYTYQQLIERTQQLICELDWLASNTVIAIIGDYSLEAIALMLALADKQCILVPITSQKNSEVEQRLAVIEPDLVFNLREQAVVNTQAQAVKNKARTGYLAELQAQKNSGLVLFSSGSTGQPKAMLHNFDSLLSGYLNKRPKSLVIMLFLMFDHIGGLNTLLNALAMGATIVIPMKREPEYVAALISQYRVQLLPASPTFLNMMLLANVQNTHDLSSLRMITYGTEAMPESLLQRLKAQLPKVKLLQTFGTSETGIIQTSSRSSNSLDIRFDDPTQEYRIVAGELWVRSQTQILGYLNHHMNSFSEDGWFKTGDLVKETEDGYLRIIGRLKEVINVGGEKVLPSEIESVIMAIDGVDNCAVYGAANAITGQTVVAQIQTQLSDVKALKKMIRQQCKLHLESYKVPTKIEFIEQVQVSERFKKLRT